ncbi:MAG: hypothetical protein WAU54_07755 [Chania sp.]
MTIESLSHIVLPLTAITKGPALPTHGVTSFVVVALNDALSHHQFAHDPIVSADITLRVDRRSIAHTRMRLPITPATSIPASGGVLMDIAAGGTLGGRVQLP